MQTFTDSNEFVATLRKMAEDQGWSLTVEARDVPMRFAYRWSWRGSALPEELVLAASRDQVDMVACLQLARATGWPIAYMPGNAPHFVLEEAPGLVRKSSVSGGAL